MHTETFHINSYDLVLLGTLFIGLTFIFLLWFNTTQGQRSSVNSQRSGANRFLALALGVVIL